MKYEGLIDTVSDIVKTYGIGILSDPKFWNILNDTYSFAGEYSLKDSFKECISKGYVSEIVSLRGKRQKTIEKISQIVKQGQNRSLNNDAENYAILFSVAIAIGSCSKKDYISIHNPIPQPKPKPKPKNKPTKKQFGQFISAYLIAVIGIITLLCGSLIYVWFLLDDINMFLCVCLIGLIQLGTLKIVDEYLHGKTKEDQKIRVVSCFIPIVIGYIINSIVPILLCFDNIADELFSYFSANFIPDSYYILPADRPFYAPRISHEVGFFGGLASLILCISLVSCSQRILTHVSDLRKKINRHDIASLFITLTIIASLYSAVALYPLLSVRNQRLEYEKIESHNNELRRARENITQDLSIKGIKLGISSETAWEYLNAIKEDGGPSELHYSETIKTPDAIYDEFIGTSYYKVYPYDFNSSGFEGVNISGDDYRMLITLDNETVGIDLYIYNGLVTAMRIYGLEHENALPNFESLLSLYKTKYGEPEIIKDFSKDVDRYSSYYSKGHSDRYVWSFKNGRIEMSEYGVMYISETLISKLRNECSEGIQKVQIEKKRQAEADKKRREREELLRKEQVREDSIRKARNHQNAINEI